MQAALGGGLPPSSTGARDDLMQMQYLQAVVSHFADPAQNPVSTSYEGRMVDTQRIHLWGWDPRPFPFWPGNRTAWSDCDDYARGAALNGRSTNRSLASVVAEICERSGVHDYDVSGLFGVVRGYAVNDITTGRSALQPLMVSYGFDAVERDGQLVFRSRDGQVHHALGDADIAYDAETDLSLSLTRAAAAEISGRVQYAHIAADGDYAAVAAEIVLPGDDAPTVTRSEAQVVLTRAEGKEVVTRWLQEARIGRDSVRFALPPSQLDIGAGDTVALDTATHQGTYRVDRIEESGLRLIEATRIEPEVYRRQASLEDAAQLQPYVSPIPAELFFLDIPILTGDEAPHAPYVAAAGRPWPGSIALYGAPQDSNYGLLDELTEPATVGVTQSTLSQGPTGIWDRQAGVEVTLINGTLSSALQSAVLAGANTIAVGDGTPDNWEILQFQSATLVSERTYRLSGLLRGQAGSVGLMPDVWPIGSTVVLLNGVPRQINLSAASRGIERHYRFGPAQQPISDPSFRYVTEAFAGIGLRPYPVAHLRAKTTDAGQEVSWIRCTRIDGDIWADGDVPLGEETELYRVRVLKNDLVVREETVTSPQWAYGASDLTAEIGYGFYTIEIAQISERFGAGLTSNVLRYL